MDESEKELLGNLFELYQERGGNADRETLASRLRRMEIGIPAEDEFAILLSWLGRCRFVHRLRPRHVPTKEYKVPDLLAIFERDGQPLPVLIEVKDKQKKRLSWTPAYFGALQRYGEEVGLPILLAWKDRLGDFWALCELRHFHVEGTNYKLTFLEAMERSLLSALAGDFSYRLQPGLGMHIHMKKLGPGKPHGPGEMRFPLQVERAYFARPDGTEIRDQRGLVWLFTGLEQDEPHLEEDATHFRQSFTIPDVPVSQVAHRVLPVMLRMRRDHRDGIRWHKVRESGRLPMSGAALEEAARNAIAAGAVKYVFHLFPK